MFEQMYVKFWGVRGSHPTPVMQNMGYGGNTSCVEVRAGGETIILDAGSGIIGLGQALAQKRASPVKATLLLSHLHHDHTQGLPFFAPIHMQESQLSIFGPEISTRTPENTLVEVMHPSTFPLRFDQLASKPIVGTLQDKQMLRLSNDEVVIRTMRSDTHPGGVMFYRIEWRGCSVVYATDTERTQANSQQLIKFARDADLLIHDAQYTTEHYLGLKAGLPRTKGWGHSTPQMACDVARAAGVKQLALFHYDPSYDDQTIAQIEGKARQQFFYTFAPSEGMSVILPTRKRKEANSSQFSPTICKH